MESTLAFLRRHILLLLIALVLVVLAAGYELGYRPGPGFTVVRAGDLVLSGIPAGGTVFADETKRAVSNGTNVRIVLQPGSHTIIVDVKGDNPWSDVVSISARTDTTVSPILVPVTGHATFVTADQNDIANKALSTYVLPDAAHPLLMENGCANVYVSDNRIVATAATTTGCTPPAYLCVGGTCATTVVFAPIAPLRSVLPYPGRQDALIISYSNQLAVIEINPLKPQFFAPLYHGIQPAAATFDATRIVVRDQGKTFTIPF